MGHGLYNFHGPWGMGGTTCQPMSHGLYDILLGYEFSMSDGSYNTPLVMNSPWGMGHTTGLLPWAMDCLTPF